VFLRRFFILLILCFSVFLSSCGLYHEVLITGDSGQASSSVLFPEISTPEITVHDFKTEKIPEYDKNSAADSYLSLIYRKDMSNSSFVIATTANNKYFTADEDMQTVSALKYERMQKIKDMYGIELTEYRLTEQALIEGLENASSSHTYFCDLMMVKEPLLDILYEKDLLVSLSLLPFSDLSSVYFDDIYSDGTFIKGIKGSASYSYSECYMLYVNHEYEELGHLVSSVKNGSLILSEILEKGMGNGISSYIGGDLLYDYINIHIGDFVDSRLAEIVNGTTEFENSECDFIFAPASYAKTLKSKNINFVMLPFPKINEADNDYPTVLPDVEKNELIFACPEYPSGFDNSGIMLSAVNATHYMVGAAVLRNEYSHSVMKNNTAILMLNYIFGLKNTQRGLFEK